MFKEFWPGFVLGLSVGGYCLSACAPIFFPYLFSEKREIKQSVRIIAEFLAGRLLAYLIFGFLAGFIGQQILPAPENKKIVGLAIIFSSLLLLIYSAVKNFPNFSFCRRLGGAKIFAAFPFLFGLLIGFNVCPPFILGFSYLLKLGSWSKGLIFFSAFFLGTTVFMLPLFFFMPLSEVSKFRVVARIAGLISGVYFLFLGLKLFL
ncbi:MAG: sulfite exporter TauE/SafE family protein [Elusimicrobiota bacterium]